MFYFQARVEQSDPFTTFHLLVLTTVLNHRQVIPYHTAIREPMYPSWVPQNTCLACTLGTSKTNPPLSYQGVQVPSKLRLQAPLLSPRLSMVLRPPPSLPSISRSRKSWNPRQESNEPSCPHKQVCAQDNKSVI